MTDAPLTRRRVLKLAAVAAAAAAAGCSSSSSAGSPHAGPLPTASRPPRPPLPTPAPSLPAVPRWVPSPREPLPALKVAAADLVQAVCTRQRGQTVADALAAAHASIAPGFDEAATLRALAPLSEGVASTGEIVYPQFGGLDPMDGQATRGAAMVVVRQQTLDGAGRIASVTRTVDVRLSRVDGTWLVTGVPSAGGEPVDRPPDLPPAALRVLDDPRVQLPDTARWDIHAGRISLDLLQVLADATALGPVAVAVLQTGHPHEVFATGRVSAHTVGRAVDIWQVAGTAVVDSSGPDGPAALLQQAALLDPRTSQVGSPPDTDVDGAARRSFANLVHEDHLHLAVRR